MIKIEIDGQELRVHKEISIIEAADLAGIYIPRFCYHKKLSVAANCRMCLVQVDEVGKPLPACATFVTPGMKVFTKSQRALDAQRSVMEFLLINHPLDCPICDQGGECELQDLAMGYGKADSEYDGKKRAVFSENIGPLVQTEMTRCIHCTRCVRFGEEVAGLRELGVTQRGEHSEIGMYVKHIMQSELSGNVIDLCPVGALTAKVSKYSVRGWEAIEHASVAPHDCVGSNIFVHSKSCEYSKERSVMRVVPKENESINESWISDRDRFSYQALSHPDRCLRPLLKEANSWSEVSWNTALHHVAMRTQAIQSKYDARALAALLSPNSTVEECYLFQGFLRALGSSNIDYRLRQSDFRHPYFLDTLVTQHISFPELENLDTIFLIGSDIRFEQPLLAHRIRKATLEGAKVFAINPIDYSFNFYCKQKVITSRVEYVLSDLVNGFTKFGKVEDSNIALFNSLKNSKKAALLLGAFAQNHFDAVCIQTLVFQLAEHTKAHFMLLTEGANARGAHLAGAIPHSGPAGAMINGTPGLNAKDLFSDHPARAYFLLGFEPEHDTAFPHQALGALTGADLVVSMTPFVTDVMKSYSDVILPIAPFTENEGTFINAAGQWQSFDSICGPRGKSKPAWKVIRGMARAMGKTNFNFQNVNEIRDELKSQVDLMFSREVTSVSVPSLQSAVPRLFRVGAYPAYCIDSVVRRSAPLQAAISSNLAVVSLNSCLAQAFGFEEGDLITAVQGTSQVTLPLSIDDRLAEGVVLIPMGLAETAGFGTAISPVELKRGVS